MKILTLPLKKKWFDMIKSGEKKEEYREINPYWIKRLTNKVFGGTYTVESILLNAHYAPPEDMEIFKDFDEIEFTLGYPKKDDASKRIVFKNPKICVTMGLRDWGAEPNKLYFVITWN